MLFSNAQKIMLQKCTYNSQYIAHYAQVESTIILTKIDMRHEETQSHYGTLIQTTCGSQCLLKDSCT